MIKRTVFSDLAKEITSPEVCVLLGARQVGKTTLLRKIQECAKKKKLKTVFFDLEQPQVLATFNNTPQQIIKDLSKAGDVILIDEFQYIKNASKIFKALFDSKAKIKIFCSGSSSIEMHKHLKESLAGRRFCFQINPLSFEEMCSFQKDITVDQYLQFGGMPGLTHVNNKERKIKILSELLSSYILKDIKALIKEENIRAFNHLLYLLAENQGNLISVHSLAKQIRLSSNAVNRYLDILEQTYVNYKVYSYSNNLGNELKKSFKTYFYDSGMRNALLRDFSSLNKRQDKGSILESFVFLQLRNYLKPNMQLLFWRTRDGDEVDFVLVEDRDPLPIEVKSNLKKAIIPKGLSRFLLRYPKTKKAFVFSEKLNEKVKHENCMVYFLPFEKLVEILK